VFLELGEEDGVCREFSPTGLDSTTGDLDGILLVIEELGKVGSLV